MFLDGLYSGPVGKLVATEIERLQARERALEIAETALNEIHNEPAGTAPAILRAREALTAIAAVKGGTGE
jgi:hypothetical protein